MVKTLHDLEIAFVAPQEPLPALCCVPERHGSLFNSPRALHVFHLSATHSVPFWGIEVNAAQPPGWTQAGGLCWFRPRSLVEAQVISLGPNPHHLPPPGPPAPRVPLQPRQHRRTQQQPTGTEGGFSPPGPGGMGQSLRTQPVHQQPGHCCPLPAPGTVTVTARNPPALHCIPRA